MYSKRNFTFKFQQDVIMCLIKAHVQCNVKSVHFYSFAVFAEIFRFTCFAHWMAGSLLRVPVQKKSKYVPAIFKLSQYLQWNLNVLCYENLRPMFILWFKNSHLN